MSENVKIINDYFAAVAKGDYATVGSFMSSDLVWYQPGKGVQSGEFKGIEQVFAHLGDFGKWSQGTFAIDDIHYITDNGDFVSVSLNFVASFKDKSISMKGIDLFRIQNGKITEVWLFSENIEEEDNFWNYASKG